MAEQAAILVVDDDREIVGAIAAALEKEGYRVLRAYDGMEALDKALDPDLRLILMDVMMPRLDGLSAVSASGSAGTCPSFSCPPRVRRATRCLACPWGRTTI